MYRSRSPSLTIARHYEIRSAANTLPHRSACRNERRSPPDYQLPQTRRSTPHTDPLLTPIPSSRRSPLALVEALSEVAEQQCLPACAGVDSVGAVFLLFGNRTLLQMLAV